MSEADWSAVLCSSQQVPGSTKSNPLDYGKLVYKLYFKSACNFLVVKLESKSMAPTKMYDKAPRKNLFVIEFPVVKEFLSFGLFIPPLLLGLKIKTIKIRWT
jgi:hypothetical protein